MNYRHSFHAGNYADVLKHLVLMLLVEHLERKPAPFLYLDTHAGRGRYDLSAAEGQRSGEYKDGIGRLLAVRPTTLLPELQAYVALVRASAGAERSAITGYPGSPLIVAQLRRPGDRMVLVERDAREAAALRGALGRQRRLAIVEGDGYAALGAYLPPEENRGLVLIDPPYEDAGEFDRLLAALRNAHARWPRGQYAIWYPQSARAGTERFRARLRDSGIRRILDLRLAVLPEDAPLGMPGCGMLIVNPPWQFDEHCAQLLPALHALLVPEGAGGASVDWLVPE